MDINREKIHELVRVFYHPTFKTFYVNSRDGVSIEKPFAVFVSLGITTSLAGLENIRQIIDSNENYTAKIAEISSFKNANGQYVNTLVDLDTPQQYRIDESTLTGVELLGREECIEELERMRQKMTESEDQAVLEKYAPLVSKLQHFVNKLDETDGWTDNRIQRDTEGTEGYRIYHMLINYKRDDEMEYRLGILVQQTLDKDE